MSVSILEIQMARISRHFSGLQIQHFSNKKLDQYVEELKKLFDVIKDYVVKYGDIIANDERLTKSINIIITFILNSIEFLEDSVIDTVPFETIFCLNKALKEWIDEEYIIVVSYKRNAYLFASLLSSESVYKFIELEFGVKFTSKLIQIAIPKFEVNDYLFNVVLYHELGHFVDGKLNISSKIVNNEFDSLSEGEKRKKENHFAEYFSDLFAAQYISKYSSVYLDFFAKNNPDSFTHPSTSARSEVVKCFLESKQNDIVDIMKKGVVESSDTTLSIKYQAFDTSDLVKLIPAKITNEKQLHYAFVAGWDLWLNSKHLFPVKDTDKLYKIINNLLEKTISNYMVESLWGKANVSN